jgi:hypothetical protein
LEHDEIREMPEIRSIHIRKYALNHPDHDSRNSYESWPMAIISQNISWLVKNSKEGGVSIQCIGRVTIIVGLVNAHAIFVNGQCPDA